MSMRILILFIGGIALGSSSCATPRSELAQTPHAQSTNAEEPEREDEGRPEDMRPADEEDSVFYRLLAAPEYLWKGRPIPGKSGGMGLAFQYTF